MTRSSVQVEMSAMRTKRLFWNTPLAHFDLFLPEALGDLGLHLLFGHSDIFDHVSVCLQHLRKCAAKDYAFAPRGDDAPSAEGKPVVEHAFRHGDSGPWSRIRGQSARPPGHFYQCPLCLPVDR